MFSADTMRQLIDYAIEAHANHAREPRNAFRKMDGKTPYAAHPTWCATTILAEPSLTEQMRELGFRILLFHDILEDTFAGLPPGTAPEVAAGVRDMTFTDTADEMENVWKRDSFILLLKLYDKTHGLMDRRLAAPEKRKRNAQYALRLADLAEQTYGKLNIVILCRALCADVA